MSRVTVPVGLKAYGSDCCDMSPSSDEGVMLERSALETFYSEQFTSSTQRLTVNYLTRR